MSDKILNVRVICNQSNYQNLVEVIHNPKIIYVNNDDTLLKILKKYNLNKYLNIVNKKYKDKISSGQMIYIYDDHINIMYKEYLININEKQIQKVILPISYILYKTNSVKSLNDLLKKFGIYKNLKLQTNTPVKILIKQRKYNGIIMSNKIICIKTKQCTLYSTNGQDFLSNKTILYAYPTNSRKITSRYGHRRHPISGLPKFHHGLDIGDKNGSTIFATAKGRVKYTGWRNGYGKTVIIKHNCGRESLYGHLSAINVKNGQYVIQNQIIGKMGATGLATAPHLHFEIRHHGRQTTDPLKLLNTKQLISKKLIKECAKYIE